MNKVLVVLKFIGRLLPIISKYCQDAKPLVDALEEVDSRQPIQKEKSWRNKLPK